MKATVTLVGVFAALAVAGGCGSSSGDDDTSILWDDASDHVGESVTVCGPIAGVGHDVADDGTELSFVNVGRDYPDPSRFTVYLPGVRLDDADYPEGATGCATGEVFLYQGVPEIRTDDVEVR